MCDNSFFNQMTNVQLRPLLLKRVKTAQKFIFNYANTQLLKIY